MHLKGSNLSKLMKIICYGGDFDAEKVKLFASFDSPLPLFLVTSCVSFPLFFHELLKYVDAAFENSRIFQDS